MIDGFQSLSERDRATFLVATGLIYAGPTAFAGPSIVGTGAQAPYVPQIGTTTNVVPRATDGPTTVNPQTGKIYRIVPPKERPAEFLRLQAEYDQAREALAAYVAEHHYVFDVTEKVTYDEHDNRVTGDDRLAQLTQAVNDAKVAIHQYKTDHPEHFTRDRHARAPVVPVRNVPRGGRGGRGNTAGRGGRGQ
jgi:hypothetical protein